MNYYYDVILNFFETNLMFYEWESDDNLECISKIPLFKVLEKDIYNFLKNNIKINKEFLMQIKDKTSFNNFLLAKTITYAAIFTDGNISVALEFDKEGKVIGRSNLLLEDDLNIHEMSFTLKRKNIKYEILDSIKINDELRKEKSIQKTIYNEIRKLYKDKNKDKLSFLFFEWFEKQESNLKNICEKMFDELNHRLDEKQIKIYEIIKLSYSKI